MRRSDRKGKINREGERQKQREKERERERGSEKRSRVERRNRRGRTRDGKRDLFPRYVGASQSDCTHGQFRTTLIDCTIERRGHETGDDRDIRGFDRFDSTGIFE